MTSRRHSPADSNAAGSPPDGEPAFLAVGKLRRPHGVQGEILMDVLTDFPERLEAGESVFAGDIHQNLHLRSVRRHGAGLLVAFKEFTTPEAVGALRNETLYVRTADLPELAEGEYYYHQMIGLRVIDEQDRPLGVISEVIETGANDVYVVRPENGPEILIPAIDPVILDIDLEKGQMRVHVLPGLLADEQK